MNEFDKESITWLLKELLDIVPDDSHFREVHEVRHRLEEALEWAGRIPVRRIYGKH